MPCPATLNADVVHVALPVVASTGWAAHPATSVAPSLNSTVPVGFQDPGVVTDTVAVNVVDCPHTVGFVDEPSCVDVASLSTVSLTLCIAVEPAWSRAFTLAVYMSAFAYVWVPLNGRCIPSAFVTDWAFSIVAFEAVPSPQSISTASVSLLPACTTSPFRIVDVPNGTSNTFEPRQMRVGSHAGKMTSCGGTFAAVTSTPADACLPAESVAVTEAK